ncbi:MAG: DUF4177 domain-containing protein [Terriglobales bacterium]
MQWEYYDRMVLFKGTDEGLISDLNQWINDAGADGWELVGTSPLVAPFREGGASATIGVHLIFKRPRSAQQIAESATTQ